MMNKRIKKKQLRRALLATGCFRKRRKTVFALTFPTIMNFSKFNNPPKNRIYLKNLRMFKYFSNCTDQNTFNWEPIIIDG